MVLIRINPASDSKNLTKAAVVDVLTLSMSIKVNSRRRVILGWSPILLFLNGLGKAF